MITTLTIDDTDFADELAKTLCWPVDLYDLEITLDVEYKVFGQYYPQTFFEPEEFPEMNLVTLDEVIISLESGTEYLLHEKQIEMLQDRIFEVFGDKIEAACWEDYTERDWDI